MILKKLAIRARIASDFWQQYCLSSAQEKAQRAHYEQLFSKVHTCCIFLGHPRSGSTLIGALLDAHPEIVMATELDALKFVQLGTTRLRLYLSLVKKAEQFVARDNYTWEGYSFKVPNQWQGRAENIRVIGDKKAGLSAKRLQHRPELIRMLQTVVDDPVKIIHVARNPFDNIATTWRRDRFKLLKMPLRRAIDDYFGKYAAVMQAKTKVQDGCFLTVYHENTLSDPKQVIAEMCQFLGVEPSETYIDDCASIVKQTPHKTRLDIEWDPEDIATVNQYIERYPSLQRYRYDQ